jgi:2-isopropylmalate synthase
MTKQNWNAEQYQKDASFVSQLGTPVLELLAPQSAEKILDLGCGDGTLTLQIQNRDCEVLGIDSSESMIAKAQAKGLKAQVLSAEKIDYHHQFDAVFTNAVLHWVDDIDAVVTNVYRALKANGKFIGEFGGQGNIQALTSQMSATFQEFPEFGEFHNPWYFPSTEEFALVLERTGFQIQYIELISRPTPLKSGIENWLDIFANNITNHLNSEQKEIFIAEVTKKLKPLIFSETEGWVADYVRIRFKTLKTD